MDEVRDSDTRLHYHYNWTCIATHFADLPIWDRLFGTYRDADRFAGDVRLSRHNERKLGRMLLFRDVYKDLASRSGHLDRLKAHLHTESVWSAGASMSRSLPKKGRKAAKPAKLAKPIYGRHVHRRGHRGGALLAHDIKTVYALPGVHNDHLFDAVQPVPGIPAGRPCPPRTRRRLWRWGRLSGDRQTANLLCRAGAGPAQLWRLRC